MAMYRKCPFCGANLDPCEQCDCQSEEEQSEIERKKKRMIFKRHFNNLFEYMEALEEDERIEI